MTETSGFNDPGSYDVATYAAALDRTIKTGYQYGYLNALAVTENTPQAMNVLVATGGAWVKGIWYNNDAIKTMTISAADATLHRIDLIVVRRSATTGTALAVLEGTAAASPSAPTLTKNIATTYEIPLAQISVQAGTTAITTAMITDKRLSSDCGPVVCEMGFLTADTSGNFSTNGKSLTVSGGIIMGTAKITGLGDPTGDQDADTKAARNAAIAAIATLPDPSGNALKEPRVNATATAYELVDRVKFVVASASDTLRQSNDAEVTVATTTLTWLKSIYIPPNHVMGGVYRVKFDYKVNSANCTYYLKQGQVTLSAATTTSATYEAVSVDATLLEGGGTIDLWALTSGSATGTFRNLRVYCDETEATPAW